MLTCSWLVLQIQELQQKLQQAQSEATQKQASQGELQERAHKAQESLEVPSDLGSLQALASSLVPASARQAWLLMLQLQHQQQSRSNQAHAATGNTHTTILHASFACPSGMSVSL